MTSASDTVVYLDWRDSSRMAFPAGRQDINLSPGKNRLAARLWSKIKRGVAKKYVVAKVLVETHPPVDDVEAAEVHDADIRRGIVESPTAKRHRLGESTGTDATVRMLQAQIEAMQLKLEAMATAPAPATAPASAAALPFDPSDATLSELPELLADLSPGELLAVIEAEKAGQARKGALTAMSQALIG
jgi:hypothetical protein